MKLINLTDSYVLLQEGNGELSAGSGYHTKQRRKESRRQEEQGELWSLNYTKKKSEEFVNSAFILHLLCGAEIPNAQLIRSRRAVCLMI